MYQEWFNNTVNFWYSSFEKTMNHLHNVQKQGEKMFNTWMEQTMATHQESNKLFNEWMSLTKKGHDDYRKMFEQNISTMTGYLRGPTQKPAKK